MAHEADVARKTYRMQCGTQGHVAEPARPTRRPGGAGGANMWQEATRVHADAREGADETRPRGRRFHTVSRQK